MTTRQKIILLHGEPGAGKDAIAAHLVDRHGFTRFAFADKLKQMCEDLDPMIAEVQFEPWRLTDVVAAHGWDEAKRLYPEVRRTQQRLATEVIRKHVSEEFWVDVVKRRVTDVWPTPVVVTDLRFESEYSGMAALGNGPDTIQTWWVKRPDNPYRIEGENAKHVSEQWHPSKYCRVVNEHDLDELYGKVDVAVTGGGFAALEILADA